MYFNYSINLYIIKYSYKRDTQSSVNWGLVIPFDICSSIWSLNFLSASLTSPTYFFTISKI
jgi:hypothetical protein